jgi:hypothetical protein
MRQVAGRALWLGNPGDTRDPRTVLDAGIEAVVELADNEPLAVLPRELVRCRFPLSDGGENPNCLLRFAAESVATFLRAKVPTLVCCSGGMNRSVCIAAAGSHLLRAVHFQNLYSLSSESGLRMSRRDCWSSCNKHWELAVGWTCSTSRNNQGRTRRST